MAVPPRLARKFRETLGAEAAEDLVHWMDHVDARDEDMRVLTARIEEWRDSSRVDLARVESTLHARLNGVESALRTEMNALGASIRADISAARADMIKWSFIFWATTLGAVMLSRML